MSTEALSYEAQKKSFGEENSPESSSIQPQFNSLGVY